MADSGRTIRHLEIADWVRELAFRSAPGTRLPSEAELSERFQVSRMTTRGAMLRLENEGVIVRRQGAGTFVKERPLHRHEGQLLSFTRDMERRGLTATSRLVVAELRAGSKAETQALRLADAERVVCIRRVRLADAVPLALETAVVPPSCVSVLAEDLETGSLHEALTRSGRRPAIAHSWISAEVANAVDAELLEISVSEPLLVERRIVEDETGEPVEFTSTAYVGSRYFIDAVFSADAASGADSHRPPPER